MFKPFSSILLPISLLALLNSNLAADELNQDDEPSSSMSANSASHSPASNIAKLVHGSCVGTFNQFIKSKKHPRVFAYSMDENDGQACGTHTGDSLSVAREAALKRCNKQIKKKDVKAPIRDCRIVAENNTQLLGLADFDIDDEAAYKRALFVDNLRGVKHFLSQGASIHTQSAEGATALFIAASYGDEDYFFELIERGADIEHRLHDNTTLLFAALEGVSPTIIRFLVDEGADVNHLPDLGYRPIHFAFALLQPYLIQLMMELNADPTLTTKKGLSGYELAEKWKVDLNSLKTADLHKVDDGCTALLDAARYGDLLRIEQLDKAGVDMNMVCNIGRNSLTYADESKKVFDLLIERGAVVNSQDGYGRTPLMTAASIGSLKNVQLLLSHGADKTLKDKDGETAFDKISSIDADELRALLAI